MIDLYRQVFQNIVIAKEIFKQVREIQLEFSNNSFKYEDIDSVNWMIENGHIGLLRDKFKFIKNNNSTQGLVLDIHPYHLSKRVGNIDTQMFIYLFEHDKSLTLLQYQNLVNLRIKSIRNIEVVKYLFENDYGSTLELDKIKISKLNIDVLQYLLDNKWIEPSDPLSLLENILSKFDLKDYKSPNKVKEMIEFVTKPIPRLISKKNVYRILCALIEHPVPHAFEALSPLLKSTSAIRTHRELFNQAKHDCRRVTNKLYKHQDKPGYRAFSQFEMRTSKFWKSWIIKGEDQFFVLWNKYVDEDRIGIYEGNICFRLTQLEVIALKRKGILGYYSEHPYEDLDDINGSKLVNITTSITKVACETGSIKILDFLINQGVRDFVTVQVDYLVNNIYSTLMTKNLSQEECDLIVKHCNPNPSSSSSTPTLLNKQKILERCCYIGDHKKFTYFFNQFKDQLDKDDLSTFFKTATTKRNTKIISILESYGCNYYDNREVFTSIPSMLPCRSLRDFPFRSIEPFINSFGDQREELCLQIFRISIEQGDYWAFKFIFNFMIQSIPNFSLSEEVLIGHLSSCSNFNIINFIMNDSSSSINIVSEFPIKLYINALLNDNELLVGYLFDNGYIDSSLVDKMLPIR